MDDEALNRSAVIEEQRSKAAFIFTEAVFPGVHISIDLKKIHVSCESEFQKIDVITTSFGKTLITDGKTQSTEMDEFVYHESLVHPPLIKVALSSNNGNANANSGPKSVFIGGGGELATAREVLRHGSVERIVMVDLDAKVLEVCRKYLPEWGGDDVANNPRLELIIGDAYAYLNDCKEKFDAIIMDISDPIEAGPGIMLYTQEFYQHAKSLLTPSGVFVTQSGIGDGNFSFEGVEPGSNDDCRSFAPIKNTLETVFDCVCPYTINIPSFGSDWGFIMAYNNVDGNDNHQSDGSDFANIAPEKIDDMLTKCMTDELGYYDGLSHKRMFALPKTLRTVIKMDTRIMTKANPVFMF